VNVIIKVFYYILQVIFFTFIWAVLREEFSMWVFISGVILGLLSIVITKKLIHKRPVKGEFAGRFPFLRFFTFAFIVLLQIYKSGFVAIGKIMKGKLNTSIVEISTDIESDILISALANAITLTPGTVTVDKKGKNLKVLWLDPVTDNNEIAGRIIKGEYEKIFNRGTR